MACVPGGRWVASNVILTPSSTCSNSAVPTLSPSVFFNVTSIGILSSLSSSETSVAFPDSTSPLSCVSSSVLPQALNSVRRRTINTKIDFLLSKIQPSFFHLLYLFTKQAKFKPTNIFQKSFHYIFSYL